MVLFGEGPDLFDRADADAVSLSQGAIDGPGFSHSHFGTVDKERDIGRVGVTIADKAGRVLGRINRCFQDKSTRSGITKRIDGLNLDTAASLTAGQPNQTGVRDVPTVM